MNFLLEIELASPVNPNAVEDLKSLISSRLEIPGYISSTWTVDSVIRREV